jgi:hypothetical protein
VHEFSVFSVHLGARVENRVEAQGVRLSILVLSVGISICHTGSNVCFLRVVRMVETRIAPRYRVMKPAEIEHGGDKIPCIVRDLSITGAALEVSGLTTLIPEKFILVVPEDRLKLSCRVVRRTDFRIGVKFD